MLKISTKPEETAGDIDQGQFNKNAYIYIYMTFTDLKLLLLLVQPNDLQLIQAHPAENMRHLYQCRSLTNEETNESKPNCLLLTSSLYRRPKYLFPRESPFLFFVNLGRLDLEEPKLEFKPLPKSIT